MSGKIILMIGIGMLVLAAIFLSASIVYRQTAGRKIREEIMRDYE